MWQKMYADEPENWQEVTSDQVEAWLKAYYNHVEDVMRTMIEDKCNVRTPYAFYRWREEVKNEN